MSPETKDFWVLFLSSENTKPVIQILKTEASIVHCVLYSKSSVSLWHLGLSENKASCLHGNRLACHISGARSRLVCVYSF